MDQLQAAVDVHMGPVFTDNIGNLCGVNGLDIALQAVRRQITRETVRDHQPRITADLMMRLMFGNYDPQQAIDPQFRYPSGTIGILRPEFQRIVEAHLQRLYHFDDPSEAAIVNNEHFQFMQMENLTSNQLSALLELLRSEGYIEDDVVLGVVTGKRCFPSQIRRTLYVRSAKLQTSDAHTLTHSQMLTVLEWKFQHMHVSPITSPRTVVMVQMLELRGSVTIPSNRA